MPEPGSRPPALPTGSGVLIVRNPQSGKYVLRADSSDIIAERLPDARVHVLGEDEPLADAVAAAMEGDDPPRVLGILGGDGSVSRMAHLARRYDRPLLVLPGGTFNHFARAVGVESVDAAIDAVIAGEGLPVTAAEVSTDDGDPVTVLNAVSIGTYPQVIAEREERMDHMGKWFGGVAATWSALREAAPVVIVQDGRRARVWSVFASVGRNAPDRVALMQRETLRDDLLDIRIHHARGSRLRAVASLAFGRKTTAILRALRIMPPESDIERVVVPEIALEVRTPAEVPSVYVHDGELEEATPPGYVLRCRIVPNAVLVYAPPASAD